MCGNERGCVEIYNGGHNMNKQKAYLSTKEVLSMLGISRSTLDRWAKDRTLKFFRLPSGHRRFFRSEIEAILKNK